MYDRPHDHSIGISAEFIIFLRLLSDAFPKSTCVFFLLVKQTMCLRYQLELVEIEYAEYFPFMLVLVPLEKREQRHAEFLSPIMLGATAPGVKVELHLRLQQTVDASTRQELLI